MQNRIQAVDGLKKQGDKIVETIPYATKHNIGDSSSLQV
jgi:hypothetical protein